MSKVNDGYNIIDQKQNVKKNNIKASMNWSFKTLTKSNFEPEELFRK